jgi:hypothetical protein
MDYSYIAGFIDADGSFECAVRRRSTLYKGRTISWWAPSLGIGITQKSETGATAVKEMAVFLNQEGISAPFWITKSPYPIAVLRITRKGAIIRLIEKILPFLIVKRRQAEVLLEIAKELHTMPRYGLGGKKYTEQVMISVLERWETVAFRHSRNRRWTLRELKASH